MTKPDRLPLRARIGVGFLALLLVAAVGGGTAVVQYGASALQVSDGNEWSSAAGPTTRWAGYSVSNRSALPVVLHAVEARTAENLRILDARVIEPTPTSGGLGFIGEPLPSELQALLATARPLDGFVLPAHSVERFQVAVRVEQQQAGIQSVLSRATITYSVLGLDHGAESTTVFCIRAPGQEDCRGF